MPGRPKAFDDEKILEILYESDDPVMTAREIAEEMDESRRTVHRRLKALRDEEKVNSKKVGGRSVIWWVDSGIEANG